MFWHDLSQLADELVPVSFSICLPSNQSVGRYSTNLYTEADGGKPWEIAGREISNMYTTRHQCADMQEIV